MPRADFPCGRPAGRSGAQSWFPLIWHKTFVSGLTYARPIVLGRKRDSVGEMQHDVTFRKAVVDTGSHDCDARLLFLGRRLLCVLVRLSDEVHRASDLHRRWYLEVGFGPCQPLPTRNPIFATIAEAKAWARDCVLHEPPECRDRPDARAP